MNGHDYEDTCRLECDECNFVWEGPESELDDAAFVHHAMTGHHPAEVAPKGGVPGPRTGNQSPAGYIDPMYQNKPVDWQIELAPLERDPDML